MIVDCFTFCDELDILEARLYELEDRVDEFVLVEATETFQGDPKPLHFHNNRERFARWPITPIVAQLSGVDPWEREASQRAAFDQANIPTDALVVVSDVDEIWRADTDLTLEDGPILILELANYVYNLGLRHPDAWSGPVVASKATLDGMDSEPFQTLRGCRLHPRPPRRRNAGWHLSWFGGLDACKAKLAAFSHTELAGVDLDRLRADLQHVDGTPLIPITTKDVPRWVADGFAPEVWG